MHTNTLGEAMPESSPGRLLATPTAMAQHTPTGDVGNAPLLWIGEPFCGGGQGFWAKLEGHNPGGIKGRAALYMAERARQRGQLAPKATIMESTSGALGLASAGITHGHPVTLVTGSGMGPLMQRLLTAYGATMHTVTEPHPSGGWRQARRLGGMDRRRIGVTTARLHIAALPGVCAVVGAQVLVAHWMSDDLSTTVAGPLVGCLVGGLLFLVAGRLMRTAEVQYVAEPARIRILRRNRFGSGRPVWWTEARR